MNRAAVITGAAGFIGSHITTALLDQDYEVRALDLPTSDFPAALGKYFQYDRLSITRRDILSVDAGDELFANVDFIFHCAGLIDYRLSIEKPEIFVKTNLMSLIRVIEAARQQGIKKVVNMSSSAVYGNAQGCLSEDHPVVSTTPYGTSKLLAERAAMDWDHMFDVPTVSLRVFSAYGPRASFASPVGRFIHNKREGNPLQITGDGTQSRDFVFVTDVVEAAVMAAKSSRRGEIYNLATGVASPMKHVAELIGGEINYVPARPGDPEVITANIDKISSHLGWKPHVSIEEGIRRTLDADAVTGTGTGTVQPDRPGTSGVTSA